MTSAQLAVLAGSGATNLKSAVTTTTGCLERPLPCEMRGRATTFSIRSCEGYSADGRGSRRCTATAEGSRAWRTAAAGPAVPHCSTCTRKRWRWSAAAA